MKKEELMKKIKAETPFVKDYKGVAGDNSFWINYDSQEDRYEIYYAERGIRELRYTCKTEEEAWNYLFHLNSNVGKIIWFDRQQPIKSVFKILYVILWVLLLPIIALVYSHYPEYYIKIVATYFFILSLPLLLMSLRMFNKNNAIDDLFGIMSGALLPIACIVGLFYDSIDQGYIENFLKVYFGVYGILIILKIFWGEK